MMKIVIPPKKPPLWIVEALEVRLARHEDQILLDRGLVLHLVRALREAAGLETEEEELPEWTPTELAFARS
jgi:hypothetical protein